MFDEREYTDYANEVMQEIANHLFDMKIAHDTGDGCVYFNDTKTKTTFRVVLEKCEYYEGE